MSPSSLGKRKRRFRRYGLHLIVTVEDGKVKVERKAAVKTRWGRRGEEGKNWMLDRIGWRKTEAGI